MTKSRPDPVIARSKAICQSTHPSSLRGVKRRGNLFFRWCKTKAGLLRLRLAMTLIPVIARSETTWQSTPTPSLRGVKRRGNLFFRWCKTKAGLLRLRLAMTVGRLAITVGMVRNDRSRFVIARSKATWQSTPTPRHCEEQSDVAIHPPLVIARSKATWQSTHPLSL